jgi:hypothetical protein
LINAFEQSWTNPGDRPRAALLDTQWQWTNYYSPHQEKVSGFTKTEFDKETVHAFRVERTERGTIELRWKPSAALSRQWLGVDKTPESPGFVLLRTRPPGVPKVADSALGALPQKYIRDLTCPAVLEALDAEGIPEAGAWLGEVAKTGVTPLGELVSCFFLSSYVRVDVHVPVKVSFIVPYSVLENERREIVELLSSLLLTWLRFRQKCNHATASCRAFASLLLPPCCCLLVASLLLLLLLLLMTVLLLLLFLDHHVRG